MGRPRKVTKGFKSQHWTVISDKRKGKKSEKAECVCVCGRRAWRSVYSLINHVDKASCGCVRKTSGVFAYAHSGTATSEQKRTETYHCWYSMWSRCVVKTTDCYKHYGGRGIRVCDRWKDFSSFLTDMGERPRNLTLERVDVNGDYCPENCTWVTKKENSRNQRDTITITLNGVTKPLTKWAEEHGVNPNTIYKRRYIGYSYEDALLMGQSSDLHTCTRTLENQKCALIAEAMGYPAIAEAIRTRLRTPLTVHSQ